MSMYEAVGNLVLFVYICVCAWMIYEFINKIWRIPND